VQTLQWDAQDLPDRQRSLQAAIGWSYELLPASEQRLFRHLGVFVGRVSLNAIEAVMGERDDEQTLLGTVSLAEKSLVLTARPEDDDTEPSFGMLETVRQFAREQLALCGELESAGRAHAQYFLELAERADPELRGQDQLAWYTQLESEHDNLRAALRWLLDQEEHDLALRLAGALGYFWFRRGYHAEGWRWLEEALSKAPDADPVIRSRALTMAGWLLTLNGDLPRSLVLLEDGLWLARQGDDRSAIARSLIYLGITTAYAGQLTESRCLLEEARQLADELQDDHLMGVALAFLAYLPWMQGDYQEAAALTSAALNHFQAVGNLASATIFQFTLALELQQLGDATRAMQLLQDGLRTSMAFKDRWHLSLGAEATLLFVGERAEAGQRARLLGAVDTLARATGTGPGMFDRVIGQRLAGVRAQLEHEGLEAAYREGRSLSFAEIVDLALKLLQEASRPFTRPETPSGERAPESPLSAREQEVLQLVAEGLTSKEIGQQLFLSPRTVDHHLTSSFNKLGVETRAQAVAVAARSGLLLPE
jgi:DNA-binding CsgD family transcriptional regulator/tetratricopeptide (TPR) repeat protein